MEQALIVGTGGGIAQALAERWVKSSRFSTVWGVTRREGVPNSDTSYRVLQCDHSDEAITQHAQRICAESSSLTRVVITLGTLHGEGYEPEKSLRSLDSAAMQTVYRTNTVLPLLWVAALAPHLREAADCRIAVLSARVGSIGDNQLGGWYSYRSSKAALNMGLRCAAIEMARRARGVKLLAYHPGTVDTALSRPFQRNVPEDRLFTTEFAAQCLDSVLDAHAADGDLSYVDWAGKPIPW